MNRRSADDPSNPTVTYISVHETVTAAVVSAIAEARNVSIDELDPLAESIDPDALEGLYDRKTAAERADFELVFSIADCTVILYGDGRVVASPLIDRRTHE